MTAIFRSILVIVQLLAPTIAFAIDVVVIEPIESSPITIGPLEFTTVTQKQWRPFPYEGDKFRADWTRRDEVMVQLRIQNRGSSSILFPTFDRIHPFIEDSKGNKILLNGCRDATCISPMILIRPGQGYSYNFIARLVKGKGANKPELIFQDLTGAGSCSILAPGDYTLWFRIEPNFEPFSNQRNPDVEIWEGKGGATRPVSFKLLPG